MNAITLIIIASLVSLSLSATHLDNAIDLVKRLNKSTNNTYGTNPNWIDWIKPAARTECNSFLNRLYQYTYGTNESYFKSWMNSTSPTAAKWHDAIEASNRFLKKVNVSTILEGDFMAIKYPPGLSSTGHAMLVCGKPTVRTATAPLVSSTTQYSVDVCDSSASYHGKNDTRLSQTSPQGIGRGTFRLYANVTTKQIVGYTWSLDTGSVYYTQGERHLAVGTLLVPKS